MANEFLDAEFNDLAIEDIDAAVTFYDNFIRQIRADKCAQDKFGISIQDHYLMDRVMDRFATTLSSIDDSVSTVMISAGYSVLAK